MKLYSWNMYHLNPDPDRAFRFITKLDFDVLCLQEVPEAFLERLKGLPYSIAFGTDVDRRTGKTIERNYCVILSKHTVTDDREFAYPEFPLAFRTKLLFWCLYPLGWRPISNRRSVFADIELPMLGRTRVFCLHLTLSYPQRLMREFDTAMALRQRSLPTIVCGDFNILESAHITVLNWLQGGRLRDIFAWRSERKDMEKKFAEFGLQNPLRGTRTQTISRSQLDHILIPDEMKVTRAEVLPDRCGSDHNPVFVECA